VSRKWYSDPLLLAVLVAVFAADQLTKMLVVGGLELGESWPVEGFLRLTHARNTGTAFGLFQNQAMVLTIVSFAAVAAIVFFYRNAIASPLLRAALGLQLGGAFGNLLDRVRLGYVVDFVDVGPWPIFNIADSSIVFGIAILAWHFWFRREQTGTAARPPAADGQPASPEPSPSKNSTTEQVPSRSSPSGDPQA
jgi:signal peptidase II